MVDATAFHEVLEHGAGELGSADGPQAEWNTTSLKCPQNIRMVCAAVVSLPQRITAGHPYSRSTITKKDFPCTVK